MAQQTINVGASPNDGTGTPLRTAFQYTNSNFTELYTATGPSGNNIVVPGSATISGDLTVDTNTLKVVSSTDSIGVGFTPSAWAGGRKAIQIGSPAQVVSSDLTLEIGSNWWHDGTNYKYTANNPACLYAPSNGSHAWYNAPSGFAAGTAIGWNTLMTLNATGLLVGASASGNGEKFNALGTIVSSGQSIGGFAFNQGGFDYSTSTKNLRIFSGTSNATGSSMSFVVGTSTNFITAATIDTSGNVGIGVTPSATDSTYYQALEITRVGQGLTGAKNALTSSPNSWLSNNSYATYSAGIVWKYAVSQPAAQYRLLDASHQWYRSTDVTPTAGNAITFTQAMTLNAAGSLVLGAAAVATTATDGFLYIPGCAGTPTGTPTAQTGRVPLVVDTTNNKLYFYSGGSWVAAN
jgi:hypothetical protein